MKREDVLIILAVMGIVHGFLSGSVSGPIFSIGVLSYLMLARNSFLPDLTVKVEGHTEMEEEKEYEFTLFLKNKGSAALVKPRVEGPPELTVKKPRVVLIPHNGEKVVRIKIKPIAKGEYTVKLFLDVEDIFGINSTTIPVSTMKLSVVPSVDSIREAMENVRNIRLKEAYKKSLFGLESLEFYGLREYFPGDDVRRIDWKASARLRKLIVRELLKERESDVYIVLDESREMRKAKIDYVSTLALYLASILIKNGYSVGLIKYWEGGYKIISPGKGGEQLEKIRNSLKFRRERGMFSLKMDVSGFSEKARRFLSKIFPKRKGVFEALLSIRTPSYLVIISDLTSNTSMLYSLAVMLKKKHKIIILSPNPVLFYPHELDEGTLKFLYRKYKERESVLRKFSSVVPVIDLDPYDYEEVLRGLE
ncbi:DUF58 domain-containing protein [Pyrococcus sp. ST04]|uniref:DUF58 domain-containing protein n=1 Tax=Pyrococcus sp. ST04 TaxID=1183377 RepID=UPI0002605ABB|nr:DUF58 domain-containing protein [Pyrococcus sp. ST04]AFK22124.1 putative DUF58 domain containing protein [Pyrococcus sp. ST04]